MQSTNLAAQVRQNQLCTRLVWVARPSLTVNDRGARGKDGLAYVAISAHLAPQFQANEVLKFGCYEYYCQEIEAIVFIVLEYGRCQWLDLSGVKDNLWLSGRSEHLPGWRQHRRAALIDLWTNWNARAFAFSENRLPAIRELQTFLPGQAICWPHSASKDRSFPIILDSKVPVFVSDTT